MLLLMSSLIPPSDERIIYGENNDVDDSDISKSFNVIGDNLVDRNYDADETNADESLSYDLISSMHKKNIISALRSNSRRSKEDLTNFSPVVSVGV